MKKLTLMMLFVYMFAHSAVSQEQRDNSFKPSGKAFGKVFWNYHYDLTSDVEDRSAFQLQRSYLGYKYQLTEKIGVNVTLDGNKSSDASDFSVYVKKAQLDWRLNSSVKLSMGMIGLKQFDTQEKSWGYRYMFKMYQDEYKLGASADMGVNAQFSLSDKLKANVFVLNGEGYTSEQDNMGRMKAGGNLIFEPTSNMFIKAYYDIYGGKVTSPDTIIVNDTASIHTLALSMGYKSDVIRLGGGLDYQINGTKYNEIAADHNMLAWSVYAIVPFSAKFEAFVNVLGYASNTLDGADESWDSSNDGNILIGGLQYSPTKGVKTALNFRHYLYKNEEVESKSLVYLNFEFAF